MADYKYTGSTPVDEPVAKKAKPAPKGKKSNMDTSTRRSMNDIYPDIDTSTRKSMNDLYPDSVPVNEPVKKASGGTASSRADGCAQRGKTKGMMR